MPIINLIQEERLAEKNRERGVLIALGVLAGTISLGVLTFGILLFQKQSLFAEQDRYQQEIANNKHVMQQIDACATEESTLKPKVQTLSEAQKVSGKWTDILTRLKTQTPADTWLTGLQCPPAGDDKPITLVFGGTAKSQEPISEFVLRAQNQPCLEGVELHYTQEKRGATGGRAIDFEVGAEIAGSADQAKTALEQKS